MVATFYPPYHFGGDAMYVYRLSNALARRGHRVTVVHNADAHRVLGGTPGGSYPNEAGVTVRTVRTRLGPTAPLVTYLSGRPGLYGSALDEVFARERFDVVHFHNPSLMGGPGALSYGDGVKLYTAHEYWLVCPTHMLWRFNREPCVETKCLRCTLTYHRPPQAWRYTSLLARRLEEVDRVLAPSRFSMEAHRRRGLSAVPMERLPYFVPAAEAASPAPPPDRRPYFLYVGRLEKLKGVQVLLELFRSYTEADLVVVGDGTYAPELRRLARGLDHVQFLGRTHPSELPSLYAGAIALLVPSLWFEVFGIVCLEAFALRTPVLVSDRGALPEVVEESGGGLVYRSEGELLDAMERLRRDEGARRELGERGHDAWRRLWTEEPHLERYFEIIDAVRREGGDEEGRSGQ
jgi:glycosyltransferase involved in cell wall biosynthesis